MPESFPLPPRCHGCGVLMLGVGTKHLSTCWLSDMEAAFTHAGIPAGVMQKVLERFHSGEWVLQADCTCRTSGCGHRASSHIGGTCFECGRAGCWS